MEEKNLLQRQIFLIEKKMENQWEFFHGEIHCIHLPERTDRNKNINDLRDTLSMPLRVYEATKDKFGNAIRGCFESHKYVMKNILQKKDVICALIFEDDVEITNAFSWKKLKEVQNFIVNESHGDWDIFFLGCFPDVWKCPQKNVRGNIYEVNATQSHAYIVSKRFMKVVSHVEFDGTPIDEVFKRIAKSYAVLPSLFQQSLSISDVSSIQLLSSIPLKHYFVNAVEFYAVHFGPVPLRWALLYILAFTCVVIKLIKENKKIRS